MAARANAPWVTRRLAEMDMAWRDHVPDPWVKHIFRFRDTPDWLGVPVHLPADTPDDVVAARDEALALALDYWAIAHVDWRLRTNIPLRPGDPTTVEEVEALLAPIIPRLRAAQDRFRALWQPQVLARQQAAALARSAVRRAGARPAPPAIRATKPITEMTTDEYLAYLFPPG